MAGMGMEILRAGTTVEKGRSKIRVKKPTFDVPIEGSKSTVDIHEMTHAFTQRRRGKRLEEVTNIPGPGSLGHMRGEFDAVTAIAPHAMGIPGGGDENTPGSDVWQVVHAGYSPEAVAETARHICKPAKDHINALAVALHECNTMGQAETDDIINKVDRGPSIEIEIEGPNGTRKETRRVNRGQGVVQVELGL
jgi:hypothetical protein